MKNYGPVDDYTVFELYPEIQITHDNIEHYRALAERRATRLAYEEGHRIDLTLEPGQATIRLSSPQAGGLTLADFTLAEVIGAQ